jgi:hypothetical protein
MPRLIGQGTVCVLLHYEPTLLLTAQFNEAGKNRKELGKRTLCDMFVVSIGFCTILVRRGGHLDGFGARIVLEICVKGVERCSSS